MSIDVGVSGVYKNVPDLWAGVGTVWKKVNEVWVGVGGVWKSTYAAVTVALSGIEPYDSQLSPADASATYALTSTGLETATNQTDSTWLLSGVASDYDCRATVVSGTLTSGTTGTWMNLGTTRSWNVARTSNIAGLNEAVLTIEIGLAGAGAALVSVNVAITAEVL